jgi:hypothetical protein
MELPTSKSARVTDLKKFIVQIYGQPKAGKSTFASKFDNALFICTEPGHKFLEVYGGDHVHKDWSEIRDTVMRLCKEDHDFQTVVIDTVDNAYEFCSQWVCKQKGIEHESDEGYGKGWTAVKKEFKGVINALANRGFGLVFISHSKLGELESKGVKRPFVDNSLSNSAKSFVNGLSDFIFYCYMDDDGNRLMRTKANLNVNAGDRSGKLPEVMPMDYEQLIEELGK